MDVSTFVWLVALERRPRCLLEEVVEFPVAREVDLRVLVLVEVVEFQVARVVDLRVLVLVDDLVLRRPRDIVEAERRRGMNHSSRSWL